MANPLSYLSFREFKRSLFNAIKQEDKTYLFFLFILTLWALVVRAIYLSQPMRYDEAYTYIVFVARPLSIGLSSYTVPNNHIFHTLLAHIFCSFLGNHPWVVRLPAFLAGVAMVPASYLAMRLLYNKNAAILTAAFVASSEIFIEYSSNARGYTIICLFFLLILSLAKYLKDHDNSFAWLLFILLSSLGFYTVFAMSYPFGVILIWLLLSAVLKDIKISWGTFLKRLLAAIFLTVVLVFVFYSPVIMTSGIQPIVGNTYIKKFIAPESLLPFLQSINQIVERGLLNVPGPLSLILLSGFIVSVVAHKKIGTDKISIFWAVVIWIGVLLSFHGMALQERFWLFVLPVYFGVGCAGINYLLSFFNRKTSKDLTFVVLILAAIISVELSYNLFSSRLIERSDPGIFREAEASACFLKNRLKPNDAVVTSWLIDPALGYYFMLHHIPVGFLEKDLSTVDRIFLVVKDKEDASDKLMRAVLRSNYPKPQLIKRFESGRIYLINGKNTRSN
ncbi:MAG: glycosyltransferase family 39 protein [Candidatus Omnitrophica bacterium]|nr:glycosyltransferase family 39 protein [Candidatus Omnitrophota bacterium]